MSPQCRSTSIFPQGNRAAQEQVKVEHMVKLKILQREKHFKLSRILTRNKICISPEHSVLFYRLVTTSL